MVLKLIPMIWFLCAIIVKVVLWTTTIFITSYSYSYRSWCEQAFIHEVLFIKLRNHWLLIPLYSKTKWATLLAT